MESGHKDWLLPLRWGAIAVIIGIITLFIISSAISIIIVLKYNRRRQKSSEKFLERKTHSAFSELIRRPFNYISNYNVRKNIKVTSVKMIRVRTSKNSPEKAERNRQKWLESTFLDAWKLTKGLQRSREHLYFKKLAAPWNEGWARSYSHPSPPGSTGAAIQHAGSQQAGGHWRGQGRVEAFKTPSPEDCLYLTWPGARPVSKVFSLRVSEENNQRQLFMRLAAWSGGERLEQITG